MSHKMQVLYELVHKENYENIWTHYKKIQMLLKEIPKDDSLDIIISEQIAKIQKKVIAATKAELTCPNI